MLVKLVGDTYSPIIPIDDELPVKIIICYLHSSALGNYMEPMKTISLFSSSLIGKICIYIF